MWKTKATAQSTSDLSPIHQTFFSKHQKCLSHDHFKQLCTATDKTTSEQFLPHEAKQTLLITYVSLTIQVLI